MSAKVSDIGLSVRERGATSAPTLRRIAVERPVLARNQELAHGNRERFAEHRLAVLNLVSSPGAGKTELLARTLGDLPVASGVIVGDLETDNDAARLANAGVTSVQITTGGVCHLEAAMVANAAAELDLEDLDLLVIENVGNLVCPAAFDLGEGQRVVLMSVTEGEDKPLKYPKIFKSADVVVVTKVDIAEAVGFDRAAALANVQAVRPGVAVFETSARTGHGLEAWRAWLLAQVAAAKGSPGTTSDAAPVGASNPSGSRKGA